MNCIKCGREMSENGVFCPRCLEVMDRYPIKPGTPVTLPIPASAEQNRKPVRVRRRLSIAEKLKRTRRLALILSGLLLVFAIALSATLAMLLQDNDSDTGRNYIIDTTQNP